MHFKKWNLFNLIHNIKHRDKLEKNHITVNDLPVGVFIQAKHSDEENKNPAGKPEIL